MSDSRAKHGLDELTPPNLEAIVDIVFVHGLHGNKENTWTATTKDGKVFWPRDLLTQDIKNARIFTWGYDSHITHFWSKTSAGNVDTHAKNLCADLSSRREFTDTTDRPIIFVGHSLGGIVCANTLVLAENSAEPYANEIASNIRGMAFLGTPHEGSNKTKWAKVGQQFASWIKTVNKEHIEVLEPHSVKLGSIGSSFGNILRRRGEKKEKGSKIEIACFFEEKETSPIGFIVTEDAARLGSYETMSIAADHRGMAKFTSKEDPGYARVSGVLNMWVSILEKEAAKPPQPPPASVINKAFFGDNNGGLNVGQSQAPTNWTQNNYGRQGQGDSDPSQGGRRTGA
ncbi:hypothetical protein BCR34DRAFT_573448 [Clohesyomyces aquaticus]|uniref:DUF676 domain-containing protein n=1 Tax=Clohesyomyces aquaticus TaxID=1231657 RepID=A0A1Y1Z0V2_9PLEO|nr:hypothetical protein BCR34DRAFT_573448 [Clohesyomyces aquaticus]